MSSCFDYLPCPFDVEVGERFVAQKKKGDRHANALKVIDKMHDHGQLGHLQRDLDDLVAPLWPLNSEILKMNFFQSSINCVLTCNFFG